jgi:hypothetical protein
MGRRVRLGRLCMADSGQAAILCLRILGSRVGELFPQARGCSPKRSPENGPRQRTARRRSWAITRARVDGPSRNRACSYSRASTSLARRHPELVSLFRGSMAGLQAPLSTLRLAPRDASRMTRGHQRKDHQDRRPIFRCALNRQFAAH